MAGREEPGVRSARVATVYCIVPRDLAGKLHEPLRRHFSGDPHVEVIVERREGERRTAAHRRAAPGASQPPLGQERRVARDAQGRRLGERRAAAMPVDTPELPRAARRHADRLAFVERLRPSDEHAEDLDTARLVARIQGGDQEAFGELYLRYFDRVYNYLRIVFSDHHEAEDATQHVFMKILEALPRYERRRQPFRAWLFVVVRNHALSQLSKRARYELLDPREIDRGREAANGEQADELPVLDWIGDGELLLFVERLPLVQRQVLMLRFMLDLPTTQIAQVLELSPDNVRKHQARGLRFLRGRLRAVGRDSSQPRGVRMIRTVKTAPVLRARRFALFR